MKLGFDFECVIYILVVSNTRRVNSTRENSKPDISALLPPLFSVVLFLLYLPIITIITIGIRMRWWY